MLYSMFGVKPVTDLVLDLKRKFLIKLVDCCDNAVCVAVSGLARAELDSLNYVLTVCLLFILYFFIFFVLSAFDKIKLYTFGRIERILPEGVNLQYQYKILDKTLFTIR